MVEKWWKIAALCLYQNDVNKLFDLGKKNLQLVTFQKHCNVLFSIVLQVYREFPESFITTWFKWSKNWENTVLLENQSVKYIIPRDSFSINQLSSSTWHTHTQTREEGLLLQIWCQRARPAAVQPPSHHVLFTSTQALPAGCLCFLGAAVISSDGTHTVWTVASQLACQHQVVRQQKL